jgi:hypothetical protein
LVRFNDARWNVLRLPPLLHATWNVLRLPPLLHTCNSDEYIKAYIKSTSTRAWAGVLIFGVWLAYFYLSL